MATKGAERRRRWAVGEGAMTSTSRKFLRLLQVCTEVWKGLVAAGWGVIHNDPCKERDNEVNSNVLQLEVKDKGLQTRLSL